MTFGNTSMGFSANAWDLGILFFFFRCLFGVFGLEFLDGFSWQSFCIF